MNVAGSRVTIMKASTSGLELDRPFTTTVRFHCSAEALGRRDVCLPGDEVTVRIFTNAANHVYPNTPVRFLKAFITEVDRNNGSAQVSWQPQSDVGDGEGELPTIVSLSATFHNGVACDSDQGAIVEKFSDVQACHAEIVVHVAALCAHPQLMPPVAWEPQVIACAMENEAHKTAPSHGREDPDAAG